MQTLPQAMIDTATAPADWVLIAPMIIALIGAALLLMLRARPRLHPWLAVVAILGIIACEIDLVLRVLETGPMSMTMGNWLPPFGISFVADAFGASFALVSAVVTLIVVVYMTRENVEADRRDGAFALVLLLLAGVTGAFLTGDFFNLYVWFEVMLIASFGLIVLGGTTAQLDGAVKYGFLNFIATMLFLLSLGFTYATMGTLNMADIAMRAPEADSLALAGIAGLLILAFATKAAAFPVNAWLPASYHTPNAAVSALFAGLLTKVGVYALMRAMLFLFPDAREFYQPVLVVMVIGTLIIAPLGAIAETNLRRAIGFMMIGGIGVAMAGIALPNLLTVAGTGFYIVHAILTMTALYLVAGLIEAMTGERDTRRMGGIYAAHSTLSVLFIVLVLAAAGVPPFLGFWPKLMLIEGGLETAGLGATAETDWVAIGVVGAILVNAWLTLIAGTRLWAHVFWRNGPEGPESEHSTLPLTGLDRRQRWAGLSAAVALTGMVFAAGLWPNLLFESMRQGAIDMLDPARYVAAVGLAPDVEEVP